jgi:hypothetical protein
MNQMADDLLNGSDSEPRYGAAIDTGMTTRPSQGDSQGVGAAAGNPRMVLLAWVIVLAILVAAHVLTLKIQR